MQFRYLRLIFFVTLAACTVCTMEASGKDARLFATRTEVQRFIKDGPSAPAYEIFAAIRSRVLQRTLSPSLTDASATTEWWHHVSEYMTDAALVHVLEPTDQVDTWLRANVLDLVRKPVSDWAGPPFRRYRGGVMTGNLETAHISWAVSICLDMAGDLFTDAEKKEIREALREKGQIPCRRYLESNIPYHNWNCVLFAGYTVTSAVLQDREALDYARYWFNVALDHFQPDGSYGESLQYANYAAYSIMLAHETLIRAGVLKPGDFEPYARLVDWAAYAYICQKPVTGWPVAAVMPLSVNFGDSAATFRPSGDLLMHIASRSGQFLPLQAGLAAWLFDRMYQPVAGPAIHDMASFGFLNDFGFLSVLLAPGSAKPLSPEQAAYPVTKAFSAGDCFLRDSWDGRTVLAFRMASEPRHASGHLHGDMNSIQLYFNGERMLADPGHSCYRNLTRQLDIATSSHNTCTFILPDGSTLQQLQPVRRNRSSAGPRWDSTPYDPGGKRLMCASIGDVRVVSSDVSDYYGPPLKEFIRTAVLCGSNVIFVVDRISSEVPVKANWNWLLDNRDGNLGYNWDQPGFISASRPGASMRITRFGSEGRLVGPTWAMLHDAYHTLPGRFCEGRPGSGVSFMMAETEALENRTCVHVIILDKPDAIDAWTCSRDKDSYTAGNNKGSWTLMALDNGAIRVKGPSDITEIGNPSEHSL